MTTIQKTFQIEAAHWLPNVPEDHKCRRMHGHSFQIEVHVEGPIDNASGWVMDFADVSDAFAPIFEQIDWSTPAVWSQTTRRLADRGIEYGELPTWYDVDDLNDLQRLNKDLTETKDDPTLTELAKAVGNTHTI